jgi:hypothetical protein
MFMGSASVMTRQLGRTFLAVSESVRIKRYELTLTAAPGVEKRGAARKQNSRW